MTNDLCEEKHKAIEGRLDAGERRMNEHAKKIDELEKYQSKSSVQIENLCKQIEDLVNMLKWAVGVFFGTVFSALIGFFVWYVQTK